MRHINLQVFCKNVFTIPLLSILVLSCGTQPIKKEPTQTEKVKSISFLSKIEDKQEAPIYMFPVDQYLWTFYKDRLVVHSKNEKKIHFYKEDQIIPCIQNPRVNNSVSNLVGHTDCIPRLKLYGGYYSNSFLITRLEEPRGIQVNKNDVILRFGSLNKTFEKDGTYLEKRKVDWKQKYVHKFSKNQKLISFRDPAQGGGVTFFNGNSGHELFPIGYFFFSGNWLLIHQRMKKFGRDPTKFKYENTKIHLVYQPTGEIVKTINSYDYKYRVREYGNGFYVDKLIADGNRPYLWFGEEVRNLESPGNFCYIKADSRRQCMSDDGPPIRAIIHNKFFRATIAGLGKEKQLYLEWQ